MIRLYNALILSLKNNTNITKGEVWIDGNKIVYAGESKETDIKDNKFEREINLDGDLIMPSFKNAHTHSTMTFGRSLSDDLPLSSGLMTKFFRLKHYLRQMIFISFPDLRFSNI